MICCTYFNIKSSWPHIFGLSFELWYFGFSFGYISIYWVNFCSNSTGVTLVVSYASSNVTSDRDNVYSASRGTEGVLSTVDLLIKVTCFVKK